MDGELLSVDGGKGDGEGTGREVNWVVERFNVRRRVEECRRCGLSDKCKAPVPFSGDGRLLVIGEAPGKQEDLLHKPFVGPAGKFLRRSLGEVGIPEGACSFANTVCCFPNRTPTKKEVVACGENLAAQVRYIRPEYILILGNVALNAWWPKEKVSEFRGLWWRERLFDTGAWCMVTWHPAAVLRDEGLKGTWETDLKTFGEVWDDDIPPPDNILCVRRCGRVSDQFIGEIGWCRKCWPGTRMVMARLARVRMNDRLQMTLGDLGSVLPESKR